MSQSKLSPPLRRQFEEVQESGPGEKDPLKEEEFSPVPGLVRRYEDRALILVTDRCFVRCSFCNRRFFVSTVSGEKSLLSPDAGGAIDFIAGKKEIREVILSGGDPMTLTDEEISGLLERLRGIDHVEMIRIGTRCPMARPERVTSAAVKMLAAYRPLIVCVHFNHPDELTDASSGACLRLIEKGIAVLNQAVLLRGVNDDPAILSKLFWKLSLSGIRPYYLFQCDRVMGTSRYWVPLERGIEIMRKLSEYLPGHAVPHFAVDLPGLEGKAIIHPGRPPERRGGGYALPGKSGREIIYKDK